MGELFVHLTPVDDPGRGSKIFVRIPPADGRWHGNITSTQHQRMDLARTSRQQYRNKTSCKITRIQQSFYNNSIVGRASKSGSHPAGQQTSQPASEPSAQLIWPAPARQPATRLIVHDTSLMTSSYTFSSQRNYPDAATQPIGCPDTRTTSV